MTWEEKYDRAQMAMEMARRARMAQQAVDILVNEAAANSAIEQAGHEHGMQAKLTIIEEKQDSIATVLVCDCIADQPDHIRLSADILIRALNDMKVRELGDDPATPPREEYDPLLMAAHAVVDAYDDGDPERDRDWAVRMDNLIAILREVLRNG